MSSWIINGMPAGLCFREDTDKVTNNNSEFLPHYFEASATPRQFDFQCTKWQRDIRKSLYGGLAINPKVYNQEGFKSFPKANLFVVGEDTVPYAGQKDLNSQQ